MKSLAKLFGMGSSESKRSAEQAAENVPDSSVQEDANQNDVRYLSVEKISPNPFQPRKTFHDDALRELSASIREFGVIQPLLVRRKDETYELVAGERRLRASKLAQLSEVPVIIKELSDQEMAELAMIENLQREDLHFLEEAEGFYQLLLNFGFTQDELAKRMGKSQSTVANKLRLLKLSPEVRDILFRAELTERHARALLKLPDEERQLEVLRLIIERSLNVRDSELLIQEMMDEITKDTDPKKAKQSVVRVVRDVRIFLNTIQHVVGEMKKSGLQVKVKQEQDEDFITVKMIIPKKKK